MNFFKKHWLLIVLALLFAYAVYKLNRGLAFAAGCGYAALAVLSVLSGGLMWIWALLSVIYAFGYVWGWLPDAFYNFWPRSQDATGGNFSASDAN
jgi:hypothetical protein